MAIDPTPRSEYEHHNEEADLIWWLEVGRHGDVEEDPDDYYDD